MARRVLVGLIALAVLLSGCSAAGGPSSKVPSDSGNGADPQPTLRCATATSTDYFPAADLTATSDLRGQQVTSEWVRIGDRVILQRAGRYEQYVHRADGVWMPDPENQEVLLQILPRTLVDGKVWSQQSGASVVWFRLRQPLPGTTHWRVTVLNRLYRYEYAFAPGQCGPEVTVVFAVYTDSGPQSGPMAPFSPLSPERRAAIIAEAPALPTELAPVREGSLADFTQELITLPEQGALSVDLDGDGQEERLVGTLGGHPWGTVEVQSLDGRTLGEHPNKARMELVRLGPDPQPRFIGLGNGRLELFWYVKTPDGFEKFNAAGFRRGDSMGTEATRYRIEPDGRLRVEWDSEERKERRVQIFRLRPDTMVELESERWEPLSVPSGDDQCEASLPPEPSEANIIIITNGQQERWKGLLVDGAFYRLEPPCRNGQRRTLRKNGIFDTAPGYGIDIVNSRYVTRAGPDAAIFPPVKLIDQTWVYLPIQPLDQTLRFDEASRTLWVEAVERSRRPLPEEVPPAVKAFAEAPGTGPRSFRQTVPSGLAYWAFGNPGSGLRFVDTFSDSASAPVLAVDPAGAEVLIGVRLAADWQGGFLLRLPGEEQLRYLGPLSRDQHYYDEESAGRLQSPFKRTEPRSVVEYWLHDLGIPFRTEIEYVINGDQAVGNFWAGGRPWALHLRLPSRGWVLTEVTWG